MSVIDSVENNRSRIQAISEARQSLQEADTKLKTVAQIQASDVNFPSNRHATINSILNTAEVDVQKGIEQLTSVSVLKHAYEGNFDFVVKVGTPTLLHHLDIASGAKTITAQSADDDTLIDIFDAFQPGDFIEIRSANTTANNGQHEIASLTDGVLTLVAAPTDDADDVSAIITLVSRNQYRFTDDIAAVGTPGAVFAWTNPFIETIRIKKVILDIKVPASTALINIGTAADEVTSSTDICSSLDVTNTCQYVNNNSFILDGSGGTSPAITCSILSGLFVEMRGTFTIEWEKI